MEQAVVFSLRNELVDRRARLAGAIAQVGEASDLVRLMGEVDAALVRLDSGCCGECRACGESVEPAFLLANPLIEYCLCALTPEQQQALERDLGLAGRVQSALLPKQNLGFAGWQTHYRYQPAGPVSGDYCDLVTGDGGAGALYFVVGDVAGKGVAASFLMAHLNALIRSLIDLGLPVSQLVERANRLFARTTGPAQYATLVCGVARQTGEVELCNAGHCRPLLVRGAEVRSVDEAGTPLGMFGDASYSVRRLMLAAGDALVLYTDGVTEARAPSGAEYGVDGLTRLLARNAGLAPPALAAACLEDLAAFQAGTPRGDDLTLVVLSRTGAVRIGA